MKFFKLMATLWLAAWLVQGHAQTQTAFWSNVKLQLPLGRWELSATGGVRLYDTDPVLKRFSTSLQGSYTFNKYLKAGMSAGYVRFHETNGEWSNRSRYFIYLQGAYTLGRVELGLYERLQRNYYHTDEPFHRDLLRSRLTAAIPLQNGRFRPWAGAEMRYSFTERVINEWRATLGNRFRFDTHNSLDLYTHYIFNAPDAGWRQTFVLGVDYIHRF